VARLRHAQISVLPDSNNVNGGSLCNGSINAQYAAKLCVVSGVPTTTMSKALSPQLIAIFISRRVQYTVALNQDRSVTIFPKIGSLGNPRSYLNMALMTVRNNDAPSLI
tara:strand:+ start:2148 stop:2474 length:327 start_codon:yes stop_codon:yes gene_type:complete